MANGRDELLKLAGLLRLGADTAREIASIQKVDAEEICDLARRAEDIATDLEKLLRRAQPKSAARSN